jgi:hypothetical protein
MGTVRLFSRVSVRIGIGLALVVAMSAVLLAQRSGASPTHMRLHGSFDNIANFRGGDCPTAVCSSFTARGDLHGTGVVVVEKFFPDPAGVSKAHTTIHTLLGDVSCSELAIFDLTPGDHPFVDLCLISGGSGRYAGASGYIQEVGTFDFATNHGQVEYSGKLIIP